MEKIIASADEVNKILYRIAYQVIERNDNMNDVVISALLKGGLVPARKVQDILKEITGKEITFGQINISPYRDDQGSAKPLLAMSDMPNVDGKTVVIIDDVISTGRTVRAAIDAVFEYGRPAKIQLGVVVDVGHRELPIKPDFVGKNIPTAKDEKVKLDTADVNSISIKLIKQS